MSLSLSCIGITIKLCGPMIPHVLYISIYTEYIM